MWRGSLISARQPTGFSTICIQSLGSVGFLAPHQLQMQVTEVARGRFPHIPVCGSVCLRLCVTVCMHEPVLLQAKNIALCARGNEEKEAKREYLGRHQSRKSE